MRGKRSAGYALGPTENLSIRKRARLDRPQHAPGDHNGVCCHGAAHGLDPSVRAHEVLACGTHRLSVQIRREIEAVAEHLQQRKLEAGSTGSKPMGSALAGRRART